MLHLHRDGDGDECDGDGDGDGDKKESLGVEVLYEETMPLCRSVKWQCCWGHIVT